ncbi:DUF1501 domain-containing protein, partial [Rhodopirellula bahusiensis]
MDVMFVMPRRESLYRMGTSLGGIALASMLAEEASADATRDQESQAAPMQPKPGHVPAKAKNCIFLMMEGGPSHIDTFDPKPELNQLHLQEFVRQGQQKSAMESGKRY